MTRGVVTPEAAVAEFRAHYLYSGNAAESARETGLNERTGRDIARELSQDPDFTEARRQMRATALEELVAMRMRVAQTALDRFSGALEAPAALSEDASVVIIDKRADYGKLVLDAEKNAHNLAKAEAPDAGKPTEVHVTITTTREDLTGVENGD